MDREYGSAHRVLATNMKDNTKMIENLDMVFSLGLLETFIKVIISKTWEMDMERCTGMMEVYIKETGRTEFSMEKDKY